MLVWTRSIDDWKEDQNLCCNFEGEFMHLPCIRTCPITFSIDQLPSVYSVALTSQKGAEYLIESPLGKTLLEKAESVFAMSKRSAKPLLERGLNVTFSNSKLGAEFCQWLIKTTMPHTHFVLPGGKERAFDLLGALNSNQRTAQTIDIYETKSMATNSNGSEIDQTTLSKLSMGSVVCFASPSAVIGFQNLFSNRKKIVAVCIGQTTANAASQFKEVIVLESPSIENLFQTATKITNE
jgi:uroporphyrinogen-III synthase